MTIEELRTSFAETSEFFALTTQQYLSSCLCDEDARIALDEIARQAFHALVQTQNALLDYLESK